MNLLAGLKFSRITARGQYNASGGSTFPVQLWRVKASGSHIAQNFSQVKVNPRQNRLRLRIPQPAIEFQDTGTGLGQHQANIKEPLVRDSVSRQPFEGWLDDSRAQGFAKSIRQQFIGRVRPHTARIRALVPVEDALMVARRYERRITPSISENDERELVPFERLLEDDSLTAGSQFVLFHHAFNEGFRGGQVRRQKDSLAG